MARVYVQVAKTTLLDGKPVGREVRHMEVSQVCRKFGVRMAHQLLTDEFGYVDDRQLDLFDRTTTKYSLTLIEEDEGRQWS